MENNIYTGSHWSLWKILLISVGGFLFFKLVIGALLLRRWLLADKKREINLGRGAIHHKPLNCNIRPDFILIQAHNSKNITSMPVKHEARDFNALFLYLVVARPRRLDYELNQC